MKYTVLLALISLLVACGGGSSSSQDDALGVVDQDANDQPQDGDQQNDEDQEQGDGQQDEDPNDGDDQQQDDPLDQELRDLISEHGLAGSAAFNRTLPAITDPVPQLGKLLFFSKSLGGDFDSACVSCHHPALGGADALSLPVGVDAQNPDLLGPGRSHTSGIPNVPRNSPTVFNVGLWDSGLFWDSRVESFGKEEFANGSVSDIRTPDVPFQQADADAGVNLAAAQARFPVTSAEEMRSDSFAVGDSNAEVREHLAARLGNYGVGFGELDSNENEWLSAFRTGLASDADAETLITFDNIAFAIGEYERSMVFVDHAFAEYIQGDNQALSDQQKEGAILFYTDVADGGAGCASCHAGDRFTDEGHHTVAFPQFGHGKGDGNGDDFGRERETDDSEDRYRFRTPGLLNVALTAPYGHAGTYETLNQVMNHYNNPSNAVEDFFQDGGACGLEQFENIANCEELYPNAEANSELALDKLAAERASGESLFEDPNLNNQERQALVAFLNALTDPCLLDRECIAPWIAEPGEDPDGQQLDAVGEDGAPL